jgi:hypothetical protein
MNGDVVVPALGDGSSTQNLQVDASGKLVVGGGGGAFTSSAGTTKANIETDNFFVGGGDFNHQSNTENKMYYDISNGSFRVGGVDGTQWDTRGDYSFASGFDTKANGYASTAMGKNSEANGYSSIALGNSTKANGYYSTSMGYGTESIGLSSTALGNKTTADGDYSTAMGWNTTASGNHSIAMGYNSLASGYASTVIGYNTVANEDYATALGKYNDSTVTGELLTVGNGTSDTTRSNAFEVYMNGDVVVPSGSLKVTELGNGSSTQNLQVDTSGKLVASSTVSVIFSSTAPSNPTTGTLWYDSAASALKIWNGSTWVTI